MDPYFHRDLLQGRCRLEFEGCEFRPTGGRYEDRAWLTVSRETREELATLLGIASNIIQFVGWFEATFLGEVFDREGEGHLGMWNRSAFMTKVLSARLEFPLHTEPRVPSGGIRELLLRSRMRQAQSE